MRNERIEDKVKVLEVMKIYITNTGEHPTREQVCIHLEKKTKEYWYMIFRMLIKEKKIYTSNNRELYISDQNYIL